MFDKLSLIYDCFSNILFPLVFISCVHDEEVLHPPTPAPMPAPTSPRPPTPTLICNENIFEFKYFLLDFKPISSRMIKDVIRSIQIKVVMITASLDSFPDQLAEPYLAFESVSIEIIDENFVIPEIYVLFLQ